MSFLRELYRDEKLYLLSIHQGDPFLIYIFKDLFISSKSFDQTKCESYLCQHIWHHR